MIASENEYQRTKALVAGLEETISRQEQEVADLPPPLRQAMGTGQASLLDEWRAEIAWYEARRDGRRPVLTFDALAEVGEALVQARLARGLVLAVVAEQVGLTEDCLAAFEANEYRTASLAQCQAMAEALGLLVRVEAMLPATAGVSSFTMPTAEASRRET